MAANTSSKRLESMMDRAEDALKRSSWFEAERLSVKALEAAREANDFEFMARVTLPLQEARRQRMLDAIDATSSVRVMDHVEPEPELKAGMVLIQPPAVAADARRLRIAALQEEIPLLVLTREPETQLGLCPVVAIGGTTIRVRIDGPRTAKRPTVKWMLGALEELGDGAINMIDESKQATSRVDALLAFLDSTPDHERLHQELANACREAAE
jgi:hypothetical protein